jgi:hypothetical protein
LVGFEVSVLCATAALDKTARRKVQARVVQTVWRFMDPPKKFGVVNFAAAAVASITLAVTANAGSALASANRASISYNLASSAHSVAVTPVTNTPVLVMGTQNSLGFRGVGFVTLLSIPSSFLEWTGLESTAGSAITQGFSGGAGTHIVFLDFSHQVDIQVNPANTFVVHNGAAGTRTGVRHFQSGSLL